ncbi:MAG: hypothetical protein GY797_32480, partial [Deltaproteobacteria bacterium]|nr:hypothetical protein [Deltaproteobacteria bacterium]
PNGKQLAFVNNPSLRDDFPDSSIAIINIDGTDFQQLTPDNDSIWPSWSPDGEQLLFQQSRKLYMMNADGTNTKTLTRGNWPSWSSNGSQIAFEREGNIFVMNSDGTDIRALTQDGENTLPVLSPDGTKVVFISTANQRCGLSFLDGPSFCTNELHVMNVDGSNMTVLRNKNNEAIIWSSVIWAPIN